MGLPVQAEDNDCRNNTQSPRRVPKNRITGLVRGNAKE